MPGGTTHRSPSRSRHAPCGRRRSARARARRRASGPVPRREVSSGVTRRAATRHRSAAAPSITVAGSASGTKCHRRPLGAAGRRRQDPRAGGRRGRRRTATCATPGGRCAPADPLAPADAQRLGDVAGVDPALGEAGRRQRPRGQLPATQSTRRCGSLAANASRNAAAPVTTRSCSAAFGSPRSRATIAAAPSSTLPCPSRPPASTSSPRRTGPGRSPARARRSAPGGARRRPPSSPRTASAAATPASSRGSSSTASSACCSSSAVRIDCIEHLRGSADPHGVVDPSRQTRGEPR